MADDDPSFKPGVALFTGKVRRKGAPKPEDSPPELPTWELQEGYRILQDLMKVSRCFLDAPDAMDRGMGDYFEVIKKPMWFNEMKRKFEDGEYTQLSEFISDVRLMLLNCYRYFGPHAYYTKRALCVESRLEQKLVLIPVEFQNQCSLEATNGPLEEIEEGLEVQSRLLHSVRHERFQREKERRQKLEEEKKAEAEGKDSDVLNWEREVLFQGGAREIMYSMWELPVIGHFVLLGLEHLNIEEIAQFEIERIFLMPQASRSLSILMTTLLSAPMTRMKLAMKPPMPYKIWTKKLAQKVATWYKMYVKSKNSADLMFEKLGIEHQFWKILGDTNPLEECEFHELTFHQRVWLIKTLCDYLLQHQKILRDLISGQPEEFGNCLGMDRLGAKFLYFRQFFGQDVRVYRQAPEPPSWIERDLEYQAELEATCAAKSPLQTKKKKRKKKQIVEPACISEEKNNSSLEEAVTDRTSTPKEGSVLDSPQRKRVYHKSNSWKHGKLKQPRRSLSSNKTSPPLLTNSETGEVEHPDLNLPPPVLHKAISSSVNSSLNFSLSEDKDSESDVNHELNKCDINGEKKKLSGDEQILDTTELTEKTIKSKMETNCDSKNTSVSYQKMTDIEELTAEWFEEPVESKIETACDPKNDSISEEKMFVVNDGEERTEEPVASELKTACDIKNDAVNIKEAEEKATKKPRYNPFWLRPSPDDFLLVADSVDGIRKLLAKYCDDDLELIQRINNVKTGKGSRPSCEIKLAKRLNEFIIELEPCELKSVTDTKKCRRKLYDEWHAFQNRPADYVDADETFWLNEKESVEVPEETPMEEAANGLPAEQESVDPIQGVEEIQNGTSEIGAEEADVSLDSLGSTTNQRMLRNRRKGASNVGSLAALWADKEESMESEADSDNSDLWEISRKKRKKKKPAKVSKTTLGEDEETGDSVKPKKQQKKKDKYGTEDKKNEQQNLGSTTTVPNSGFEGAFSAWLGNSTIEQNKTGSKKSIEPDSQANVLKIHTVQSLASVTTDKHPPNASAVRKKLFENSGSVNVISITATSSSTVVTTTASNRRTLTTVSPSTSIVLKHMAQNFAEPAVLSQNPETATQQSVLSVQQSTPVTSTASVEEVVILSDDSDDDIQFVSEYKPPSPVNKPPRTRLVFPYSKMAASTMHSPQSIVTKDTLTTMPIAISQAPSTPQHPASSAVQTPVATTPVSSHYSQQSRRSTPKSAAEPASPTTLLSSNSPAGKSVVVGTIGNSSILLTSPRQSSPATVQRVQRIKPLPHSPVTQKVVQPLQGNMHSASQVTMRPPAVMTVRSPAQVTVRSPSQLIARATASSPASQQVTTMLPVGTEVTIRPSSLQSVQTTQFSPSRGRIPGAPATTPPSIGNMALVARGTTATLVVIPGDGNAASNYALAFSNGTRMILTPEQVAQIRAENNGHLPTSNLNSLFGK